MKTDPSDPDVGQRRWLVKRNGYGKPSFYYAESPRDLPSPNPESSLKTHGLGTLHSTATDEIEETIDLEEHVGEVVATVTVDVDAWEYQIDYEVDVEDERPRLVDRIRGFVP